MAADEEVWETLRAEAARRGISLATLASEILSERAVTLRRAKRPRVGIGRSGTGVAQESVDHEDLPAAQ